MDGVYFNKPFDFTLIKQIQQHRDIMYNNKKKEIIQKVLLLLEDKLKHT